MTTITLEIPNKEGEKYKKILSSFIRDYNIVELEQIKNDYNFSIMMNKEYLESGEGKEDSFQISTKNKSKNDINIELNKNLWN